MTATKFVYLDPIESSADRLLKCDFCGATEVDDILAAPRGDWGAARPMYHDTRDWLICCLACAESGEYLRKFQWQEPAR